MKRLYITVLAVVFVVGFLVGCASFRFAWSDPFGTKDLMDRPAPYSFARETAFGKSIVWVLDEYGIPDDKYMHYGETPEGNMILLSYLSRDKKAIVSYWMSPYGYNSDGSLQYVCKIVAFQWPCTFDWGPSAKERLERP